ncbi:hypothetical protein [Nocardia sp. NPDC060249]|uniref:hypothetical protein n=1 Tax=Nocardia sp. NPDC060249 TaxID=3347082 RepID=UPI003649BD7E
MTPCACPVCLTASSDPQCPACGWVLTAGPWLGAITQDREQAFAADLMRACRRVDIAAAARVAAVIEPHRRGKLLGLVRGTSATEDELTPVHRHPTASDVAALRSTLGWLVEAGERTLTVIDIDSSGIEALELAADAVGVVRQLSPPHAVAWTDLVSGLSSVSEEALFQLAGGVGVLARTCQLDLARAGRELPAPVSSGRTVVLQRLSGWHLPDRLAARWPEVHHVSGSRGSGQLIRALAAHTPLRNGYHLLAVAIDSDGWTRPHCVPLFPAGAKAIETPPTTVAIELPAGAAHVLVAITAHQAIAARRGFDAVRVLRWLVPETETATLEFTLNGPGDVVVRGPGSMTVDTEVAANLATLIQAIPERYRPPTGAVDVAFAVELCGTDNEVTQRRQLLADWLAEIADRHFHQRGLRVAIIGYHDHQGPQPRGVVRVYEFDSTTTRMATIADLTATRVRGADYLAPLEDALELATTLSWRTPAVSRRLLIVGRRAPYGDDTACPNRLRWQDSLGRLRANGIEVLAVWDTPPGLNPISRRGRQMATVWRALSLPGESRELGKATPSWLTDHLRLPNPAEGAVALQFPIIDSTKQEFSE